MTRELTFAFGDIHGRLDLLKQALSVIEARSEAARLVFLGDYVDRGPDSRGTVELLIDAQARYPDRITCLKGNHEAMLVNACRTRQPRAVDSWLGSGGFEAMISYGWDGEGDPDLSLVPERHVAWMEALPFITTDQHRIYVHAGVRPGRALNQQLERDCLWIRDRFLATGADELTHHIVHGHTPSWAGKRDPAAPELLPHRTNLDTMAYQTGVLTVGVFDPQLAGGPVEVMTTVLPSSSPARL